MLSTMSSSNGPNCIERQVSSFGVAGLAENPRLTKLPKARRDIILGMITSADANGDGKLTRDEFLESRECRFGLGLPFTMNKFVSLRDFPFLSQ